MKGKKHWRLAVLLLTIAVLVSGCNLFAKPNRYIEGEVTMGDGKSPLGPAKIYVDDELKVETGADGKFKISVKPGSYKVKAAYGERTSAVETVNVDREDVKVVLKIEGLGHVSGKVKLGDGSDFVGATVTFGNIQLQLDDKGAYSTFVEPGQQQIKVEYKGFVYTETYNMPSGNATKDITVADLLTRTITLKDKSDAPHKGVTINVKVGTFADSVITNDEGKASLIAPKGDAQFSFDLPIPGSGAALGFTEETELDTATTLVADIEDRKVFFDDFSSDTGAFVLSNTAIADGKLTSVDRGARGTAWLKSTKMGIANDYLVVVKGYGDGMAYRVNAYVPDDWDQNIVFAGYQSAIYVKGTGSAFQISSFHGSGAPMAQPWWGQIRDLDFNNGLIGGDEGHPIIEPGSLMGIGYIADEENVFAAAIRDLDDGNHYSVYFNGQHIVEAIDTDEAHEYPWAEEPVAYQHTGGGIVLVFEVNADKVFYITEIAVYEL
jgi:hypothetical protein